MPLLLTSPAGFQTSQGLDLPAVYAIIRHVEYDHDQKFIRFAVGYYPNEQAYVDRRTPLQLQGLQTGFGQEATPQEANAVPIFSFLEQILSAQLRPLLGEGATIETVA